ncbi:hypothetical protein PWK20_002610 [Enterococcus faecalis]|nr:hypothetical protein [Enterococcus faecalis]HAP3440615.1 hypothetical protein [Enterococcus faecalis]HAP4500292.1 hypothetical protein [Enterococcus faecalis]
MKLRRKRHLPKKWECFFRQKGRIVMILQYAMRLNEEGTEKAEHIEDGVTSVAITENEIKVYYEDKRGVKNSTTFLKDCSQIYNMWLLSDTFKTLKRLI